MCRLLSFLMIGFLQVLFIPEAMGMLASEPGEDEVITSQPGQIRVDPGLTLFKEGIGELNRLGVVASEDGSIKSTGLLIYKALDGGISNTGPLELFRKSNELGYEPSRSILILLLSHASGIYMKNASLELSPMAGMICCVAPLLLWAPPVLRVPVIEPRVLRYGTHVCGMNRSLRIHYRLLLEKRTILDQVLDSQLSDAMRDTRQEDRKNVERDLLKTASFLGRSTWGGFCCNLLSCVGLPLACCKDEISARICRDLCGPKDHLPLRRVSVNQDPLNELLLPTGSKE